ncbi:Helicase C-terminal [Penicillium chermesinum]|nr:Helicase C-terminal [Penicillium chermesinum]
MQCVGMSRRSLVGIWRLFPRTLDRPFTTSSPLLRSKKRQKQNEHPKGGSERQGSDAKKIAKALGSVRKPPSITEQRNFSQMVEAALLDCKTRLRGLGELPSTWDRFERQVINACRVTDSNRPQKTGPLTILRAAMHKAYITAGAQGLRDEIEYMVSCGRSHRQILRSQPRSATETGGPPTSPRVVSSRSSDSTNNSSSRKTYHALKRLETSKNGFYAGPLRLLAQEVYHRFKDQGIPSSLVTGDEVKSPEDGQIPHIVSNTVEMVSMGQEFEVGVIDEIQMIADSKRGWAWTRAVLGAITHELHLCGEVRAVPLIRELCALTGDKLEIHRYERLNGLEVAQKSIRGDLSKLEKGDCLVVFSRVGIHTFKQEIEKATGRRVAIVYGGLPAEIRTQQANLFNDPDNDYDFLVASDAIGMGLNLSIKRVIFETLIKRTKQGLKRLTVSDIRQIGGRAGRYRAAGSTETVQDAGIVTSFDEVDLPHIKEAMDTEPPPIRSAGIWPPNFVIHKLAAYFPPGTPFEYIIKRLLELVQTNPLFFICEGESQLANAEIIDSVSQLSVTDQLTLMAAPMDSKGSLRDVCCSFADCVAENSQGRLLEIPGLNLEILQSPVSGNRNYLSELEALHQSMILYSWLSFRFGGVFTDRTLAAHVKEITEQRMIRALTEFSANKTLRRNTALRREIALQKQLLLEKQAMAQSGIEVPSGDDAVEDAPLSEIEWPDDAEAAESEAPLEGFENSTHDEVMSHPQPQTPVV